MFRRFCFSLKAPALTLVSALTLGACHGLVSDDRGGFVLAPDLGLNSLMAVPQPFRAKKGELPLINTSMGKNDVAVPAIAGLSIANNHIIGAALIKAADDADILVLRGLPDRPTYVLEGVATQTADSISIKWYLRNSSTHLMQKFDASAQLLGAAGSLIPDDTARAIAEATTAALSSAMASSGGVMKEPARKAQLMALPDTPPKIRIGQVTGAPGDGDRSLPNALKMTMGQDGVPLTEDVAKADFTLIAKIAKEPVKDGTESIAITWQVVDQKGQVAGEITQSNEIKAGALDGAWGQTAFDIALAAESGLGDMLSEIRARATGAAEPEESPGLGPVIPDSVLHRHDGPHTDEHPKAAVGKT